MRRVLVPLLVLLAFVVMFGPLVGPPFSDISEWVRGAFERLLAGPGA